MIYIPLRSVPRINLSIDFCSFARHYGNGSSSKKKTNVRRDERRQGVADCRWLIPWRNAFCLVLYYFNKSLLQSLFFIPLPSMLFTSTWTSSQIYNRIELRLSLVGIVLKYTQNIHWKYSLKYQFILIFSAIISHPNIHISFLTYSIHTKATPANEVLIQRLVISFVYLNRYKIQLPS